MHRGDTKRICQGIEGSEQDLTMSQCRVGSTVFDPLGVFRGKRKKREDKKEIMGELHM